MTSGPESIAGGVARAVQRTVRADGTVVLTSLTPIGPVTERVGDWLDHWAAAEPDRISIAERSGAGWRADTYATLRQSVRAIAASLLDRGLGPDTRIVILARNGLDHARLSLAAQYVGVPVVPVAEPYGRDPGAWPRLRFGMGLVKPHLVYMAEADAMAGALDLDIFDGVEVVASDPGRTGATPFSELLTGGSDDAVTRAAGAVTGDSVAKIMLTSGSTKRPRGVVTTHRMLCVNQAQMTGRVPVSSDPAPRIVDWLPWTHCFGGSHNFNMMLAHGGALYIDDGQPTASGFARTLENLALMPPTLHFNVPAGLARLHDALRADDALRDRLLSDLDLVFYAGASLPQPIWDGLAAMARKVRGATPVMMTSWGLSEAAPACIMPQRGKPGAGHIGLPLPGVSVKLVPAPGGRAEVRVAGPNVMPKYFAAPEATAEVFDVEGYLRTGDAVRLVDPDELARGMEFQGRISEDFKLSTGTWVRALPLRARLLAALAPLVRDAVLCGLDRAEVGALAVPDLDAIAAASFAVTAEGGVLDAPALRDEIARRLCRAMPARGTSARVARVLVLAEPPSFAEGELTLKNTLNVWHLQDRRSGIVDRLYSDDPVVARLDPAPGP